MPIQGDVTAKEALWIARAMAKVSAVDGVNPKEQALIDAFLDEIGADASFKKLAREKFDPAAARRALSAGARVVLLESCWMVALADGEISAKEKQLLAGLAEDLGVEGADSIRDRVVDRLMAGLAHIKNVDALAEVAAKLQR